MLSEEFSLLSLLPEEDDDVGEREELEGPSLEELPLEDGGVREVEELEEVLQAFRQLTFPTTSPQTPPASQMGVVQVCPHVNPPTPAVQDVHTVDPPPHCVDTVQTREDEGGVRDIEELVLGQNGIPFA